MKKSDILFLLSLFRRAFHRSIRTIHTTVAGFWAQDGFTVFAFIKKLAAICRKCLLLAKLIHYRYKSPNREKRQTRQRQSGYHAALGAIPFLLACPKYICW
jgi:hypothetical protein